MFSLDVSKDGRLLRALVDFSIQPIKECKNEMEKVSNQNGRIMGLELINRGDDVWRVKL